MYERTAWDDRIPRPTTLIDPSGVDFTSHLERALLDESEVAMPMPPTKAPETRRDPATRVRLALAATVVVGVGVGLTAGYVLWDQPKQQRIDQLQAAVAAASVDAAELKGLSDDKAQLAEKLAAASGDATACRKAAGAAQGLDAQWRAWAQEFEKFADVVTEAQAQKLATRLQARYDKIVRQEGRVDALAEACTGRNTTAQV